jgi:hypothetical protein
MIDPKELRICNWVMFQEDSTICNVKEIALDGLLVWFPEKKVETWIELDQFGPIPLTPEILEKAGFKNKGHEIFVKDRIQLWAHLAYYLDEDLEEAHFIPVDVTSLHQLQNLYYSLTGQELPYAP